MSFANYITKQTANREGGGWAGTKYCICAKSRSRFCTILNARQFHIKFGVNINYQNESTPTGRKWRHLSGLTMVVGWSPVESLQKLATWQSPGTRETWPKTPSPFALLTSTPLEGPWKFICVQLKTFQISIKCEIGIFRRLMNGPTVGRSDEWRKGRKGIKSWEWPWP